MIARLLVSPALCSCATRTTHPYSVPQAPLFAKQLVEPVLATVVDNTGYVKMASKPKVLVTRGDHDPDAIARLSEVCDVQVCPEPRAMTRQELLKGVVGKDALLILPHDKMDEELLDTAGDQLKVVSTHSVGYDHINRDLMRSRNIKVGYTPDVLTNDVADLNICLTLSIIRRVKEHIQYEFYNKFH